MIEGSIVAVALLASLVTGGLLTRFVFMEDREL